MAKNKNPWNWMDQDKKFSPAYDTNSDGKRFFSFKKAYKYAKALSKNGHTKEAKVLYTRASKAFASYAKFKGFTPKNNSNHTKARTAPKLSMNEYNVRSVVQRSAINGNHSDSTLAKALRISVSDVRAHKRAPQTLLVENSGALNEKEIHNINMGADY